MPPVAEKTRGVNVPLLLHYYSCTWEWPHKPKRYLILCTTYFVLLIPYIPWVFAAENDLVQELDEQYEQHFPTQHHPLRKRRQQSTPSQRPPPANAPKWAIRQS